MSRENRGRGHWEICRRCEGNGTHVNPDIDGNGLAAEDFAEDPDFAEGYFSGRYDIACQGSDDGKCEGGRVWINDAPLLAVDEDGVPFEDGAHALSCNCAECRNDRAAMNAEARYWRRLESPHEYYY